MPENTTLNSLWMNPSVKIKDIQLQEMNLQAGR
jgi:hypothetical protein